MSWCSTYTGRGGYFGEMGLLGGGVRTATCTALDHVDVVRIKGEDFALMVERFPDIRASLEQVAAERAAMNLQRARSAEVTPLNDFLAQGLMEAQSLLVLDLEKCTRCDECVRACADAHDGVTRLVREGLRFDKYLVATSCRQCRDPLCMVGLPGRIDPPAQLARDHHRGLVHRLRPVRQQLPVRQPQHARVRSREPVHASEDEGDAAQGDRLRPVHGARGTELRLRLPARRRAPRGAGELLCVDEGANAGQKYAGGRHFGH